MLKSFVKGEDKTRKSMVVRTSIKEVNYDIEKAMRRTVVSLIQKQIISSGRVSP
jgi:hypothetical protein